MRQVIANLHTITGGARLLRFLAAALAVLLLPRMAAAQAVELEGLPSLELDLQAVGPGDASRAGDWTGLLVRVRDNTSDSREVILRVTFEDEDGDEVQYDRVISTTPARWEAYWIYARIPYWGRQIETIEVRAFDAVAAVAESDLGFRAGRLLQTASRPTTQVIAPWDDLVGVIGRRDLQLKQYGREREPGAAVAAMWHNLTFVASGLRVGDLPDRWLGLAPMSTLVWSEVTGEYDPSRLAGTDRAPAIREWVQRGGHLVVVWPSIGETWASAAANPLVDLLPSMRPPRALDGRSLEPYRELLTGRVSTPLPDSQTVHVFERDPGAPLNAAIEVLSGPDGECLAMRRIVGAGMVTVVGIDISVERMLRGSLPEVENFWNRVLGRRGEFFDDAEMLEEFGQGARSIGANRIQKALDGDMESAVQREGQTAGALLLGVVVFALYWVFAGPVGFYMLKRSDLQRHAWVVFVGAVAVFTAVSWTGAAILRPKRVDAEHIAIVEQVYGEEMQRGRMWASVLVPWYGEARFAIADGGDASVDSDGFRNALAPWEGFDTNREIAVFPDNRGYRVRTQTPGAFSAPVRATVKQFRADWAGAPRLGLPRPTGEVGDAEVDPIELTEGGRLTGLLRHDLPAPLTDVSVIWVTEQAPIARTRGRGTIAAVNGVSLPGGDRWEPGKILDLGSLTSEDAFRPAEINFGTELSAMRNYGVPLTTLAQPTNPGAFDNRLIASMFYYQIEPPRSNDTNASNAVRVATHAYDLSRWLTQPCVIVVGFLDTEDQLSPVPFSVDGEPVKSSGRTMVRWIYPLPSSPPRWSSVSVGDED